ncbi:MAG: hypothetical protein HY719_10570, partial [Planctomycetes bacterium]|nr:hypothetical protein [Planctomycetota bacterium]
GEDGAAGRGVRFSPFFSYLEEPERDRTQLDVLYPLLSRRTDGKSSATRLIPLAYYKNVVRPDGTYDWDVVLIPFLFLGDSNDADREGAYLGVMPFGGTLKGFLGKEHIDFVLFPAYYHAMDMYGYSTYFTPFPFVGWGSGGGKDSLIIWPFYGNVNKHAADGALKYDRTTILWPVVNWQTNDTNTPEPESVFALFPFYGQWITENRETGEVVRRKYSVLWPLFQHARDDRVRRFFDQEREVNFALQRTYWGLFWPLGAWETGFDLARGEVRERRLLPFYWYTRRRGREETRVMFPIYWHDHYAGRANGRPFVNDYYAVAPVLWYDSREYTVEGVTTDTHWFKVWPFFSSEKEDGGARLVEVLSPFPAPRNEGWDRTLGPLWRLFEYRSLPEGDSLVRVLGPVFKHRWSENESETHLLPIYSRHEVRSLGLDRTDLFWGLFGWGREHGQPFLKLFFFLEVPLGGTPDP